MTKGLGNMGSLAYRYDAAGNLTGITGSGQQTFGYDAPDRLTSATGPYDGMGYFPCAGWRWQMRLVPRQHYPMSAPPLFL